MTTLLLEKAPDLSASHRLNEGCQCVTLRRDVLRAAMAKEIGDPAFWATYIEPRPHLFADVGVFLSREHLAAMTRGVAAIEEVAALPGFRDTVLGRMPGRARRADGPRGAFMGFDFHLAPSGPQLIEINTNAGGAFLNAYLVRAQEACCGEAEHPASHAETFEADVVAMFRAEWALHGATRPLRRVAIVDDGPEEQYLYPEFLLAQRMLQQAGIDAVIADAAALEWRDGALFAGGAAVDVVYNRLVDFGLDEPRHAALRAAYDAGAVAVTPNPETHALYADKRNLVLLSDGAALQRLGASAELVRRLDFVPRTLEVSAANAAALWDGRKGWFFKPAAGYGSKAVYRGDKITRGAWAEVVAAGGYVAQTFAAPGERVVTVEGTAQRRKVDVRLYTYAGRVLLTAARIYQGQATNFRTPGGGFAPLLVA